MLRLLEPTDLVVLDPYIENFPKDDSKALENRTLWEFDHLRRATIKLFWFPGDALGMISLYELGAWSMTLSPLLVGVDREYRKCSEILAQLRLSRPDVTVVHHLKDLVQQVIAFEKPS